MTSGSEDHGARRLVDQAEHFALHALDFVTARSTAFGERHSIDWLTYSPLQMLSYHRLAARDAPAVIDALTERFPAARQFADIGCGSGAYAAECRRRGLAVSACEHARGGRLVARAQHVRAVAFELDEDPPAVMPGVVDLAYSFEVAEHCTPAQGEKLVQFMVSLAPLIVFTAAHPGQGGLGHINEQPQSYWIERFEAAGAEYQPDDSAALSTRFANTTVDAFWLAQNVMVFRNLTYSRSN